MDNARDVQSNNMFNYISNNFHHQQTDTDVETALWRKTESQPIIQENPTIQHSNTTERPLVSFIDHFGTNTSSTKSCDSVSLFENQRLLSPMPMNHVVSQHYNTIGLFGTDSRQLVKYS